jgi:limonene-1,2-epoxide hydrolase
VVTAGGLIGEVLAIREDQVTLRSGTSTVVVEKARVLARRGAPPQRRQVAMAILKIETLGSEVLRRRADEVEVVADDPESSRLIEDMFETMYDAHGIGLAAPQVGISRR